MIILLIVLFWLMCALGAAGMLFAHVQDSWPSLASSGRRADLGFALGVGLLGGPIALLVSIFATGFCEHGWRMR